MTKTQQALASCLRNRIGRHYRLLSGPVTSAQYLQARDESDRAEALARYIIAHGNCDRSAFARGLAVWIVLLNRSGS